MEGISSFLRARPSSITNLAAAAGSRLGSCLLDDLSVPVLHVLPSGDLYVAGDDVGDVDGGLGAAAQRVDIASLQ